MVRGRIGGPVTLWFLAKPGWKDEGVELCALEPDDYLCHDLEALPMSELRTMEPGTWSKASTFFLEERLEGSLSPEALAHTDFITRSIATTRARQKPLSESTKVYDAVMEFPELDRQKRFADKKLSAWVVKHRDDDALYDAFSHYRNLVPRARDISPYVEATLFAELALARGDLPTFVDMQIELINDEFAGRGWANSFYNTPWATRAERLAAAKLDVDALLLALVIQHPRAPRDIPAGRLALAMREAGRVEALLPRLEALATSPSLDPYNRFRATSVWLGLQLYDKKSYQKAPAVLAKAATLNLDAVSRARFKAWDF